jgi:hypothetical protein
MLDQYVTNKFPTLERFALDRIRVVIEPTASGRKWTARLGARVLCESMSPFVKSARLLLDEA